VRVLFIDRVLEFHHRERIVARVDLSADEALFSLHFPANPILPASALLEAFAQAATILIEVESRFTLKALPAYIQNAKFIRPVRPAGPVQLDLSVEHWSEDAALLRGVAVQFDRRCASCTIGMTTAPLSLFYGPEHATEYGAMYARLLEGARWLGFESPPTEFLPRALAR
jgi:3-hydroxymyristoyl/3-hydroxydecanoyl-(acyl carrier protein) dehydratase